MTGQEEIEQFLRTHLETIRQNDIEGYHRTTDEGLTLYEWWVTPHRIDGLGFHDFLITENARKGTVFGSEADPGEEGSRSRFDLSNLKIQRYGDTAVASYTLLTTTASPQHASQLPSKHFQGYSGKGAVAELPKPGRNGAGVGADTAATG